MKLLLDSLRDLYRAFGAAHPLGSMIVVVILGGFVSGLFWKFAETQYQDSLTKTPAVQLVPSTGTATTTGAESPAITGPNSTVTYGLPGSGDKTPKKKE